VEDPERWDQGILLSHQSWEKMGIFQIAGFAPELSRDFLSLPPMGLKNQRLQHLTVKYGISL
jgi:hypothetical protein